MRNLKAFALSIVLNMFIIAALIGVHAHMPFICSVMMGMGTYLFCYWLLGRKPLSRLE